MYNILVVNIGSTSFKYQLLDMEKDEHYLAKGKIDRVGTKESYMEYQRPPFPLLSSVIDTASGYDSCIKSMIHMLLHSEAAAIKALPEIKAIGFKAVHAGEIREPSLVNKGVLKAMEDYSDIMPAHNPPYVRAIRQFKRMLPKMPMVVVFETYFHKDIPDHVYTYSVPYEWFEKHKIRKYGFHGASHRFVTERAANLLGQPLRRLRIISCHLGGSSSICAVKEGRSVDNSMGFSAQAGIPMSNRCGDIDPFIIPFIMRKEKLNFKDILHTLTTKSGLLGISGISGDVRDLEHHSKQGHNRDRARLAIKVFATSVKKYVGSYIALMGGIDTLIFTGGIGENSPGIRKEICNGLDWLGIRLDAKKNRAGVNETVISKDKSKVQILIIPTFEELIVARETMGVLKKKGRQ